MHSPPYKKNNNNNKINKGMRNKVPHLIRLFSLKPKDKIIYIE